MAWIESHQSLGTHKKLFALCEKLKIKRSEAIGILHLLWWWALDNAPDGDLSGVSDKVLAEVSGYIDGMSIRSGRRVDQRCKQYGDALRSTGFIDSDGTLHDWHNYAGKLIEKRRLTHEQRQKGGKSRMNLLTDEEKTELAKKAIKTRWDTSRNTSRIPAGYQQIPATVPNPTVPNPTIFYPVDTNGAIPITDKNKIVCDIAQVPGLGQKSESAKKLRKSNHPLIAQMQEHLGYPAIVDKDPVPNPAKEGNFIKKMQIRGFSEDEIMSTWKAKVKAKNNSFVSMQWVNEDIGQVQMKGGTRGVKDRCPEVYTP
jgi:hypothetical protein